jgi:hypothetical protein
MIRCLFFARLRDFVVVWGGRGDFFLASDLSLKITFMFWCDMFYHIGLSPKNRLVSKRNKIILNQEVPFQTRDQVGGMCD